MKISGFLFFMLLTFNVTAEPIRVTFIVPDQERPTYFWHLVMDVAKSVAMDVDVKLEILFSDYNRFGLKVAVQDILASDKRPDYIIFRPFKGNAVEVFNMLASSDIPFITLEHAFSKEEAIQLGSPGQNYPRWLGMVNYDDVAGGALLTSALYKHHKRQNPKSRMEITGLGGDFDQVSMARQAHLDKALFDSKDISINQVFPMQWSPDVVTERFSEVFKRYPDTDAFWCAGDLMAVAVADQLDKTGWPKDKQIVIGGFDWLPQALNKVNEGKLTASVGGHFLMAAKAILQIVKYHHGNDVFTAKHSPEKYELIDRDNIGAYLPFMLDAPWQEVDFRQFSSIKNPHGAPKELSVANLFDAYQQLKEVR